MTNTALTRLQEEIDAIQQEAFAAGYAAAMRSVREFASKPVADLEAPCRRAEHMVAAPLRRLPRGTNARLIEAVLRTIAPRAARANEIRRVLRQEQGVVLAFTSIRHALGQLEARHIAEHVAGSKSWRYRSAAG
jgi:hypothetical protein